MEEALWKSADKLRGSVEPAEYKHVVLSLFFLKFASDKFEAQRKAIHSACGSCKAREACGLAEAQDKIVVVKSPDAAHYAAVAGILSPIIPSINVLYFSNSALFLMASTIECACCPVIISENIWTL